MDEDIILPDESVTPTEESAAEQAETKVEETKPTEEQPEVVEQPKVKLKYNHEEKEYSLDEVVPLAQKGMNYDKLQERLQALEADPRMSKYDKVKQLADAYGMSDDDLLDALYNQYYEQTAKNNGLTPEQVRKDHELKQKEQVLSQREQQEQQKSQQEQMYQRFVQNYPDAKVEDIKPETWQKVQNGMDLTTAYTQQVNSELQAQLKVLKQNEENAKKAPVGSVTAHGSKETGTDPFLAGFDSV